MDENGEDAKERQITLTDMKLLITAVITFDSAQIVSAFLHVQRLRETLLHQISKSSDLNGDVFIGQSEIAQNYSPEDVSMVDRMQSVFLRPDTPVHTSMNQHSTQISDESPSMLSNQPSASPSHRKDLLQSTGYISVRAGHETDVNLMSNVNSVPNVHCVPSVSLTSIRNGLTNKTSRLIQMLGNRPSDQPESKRLHDICTQQVANVVGKSSITLPRQRKRKNTAPRYNPYQSQVTSNGQPTVDGSTVSDRIAMLLGSETPTVNVSPSAPIPPSTSVTITTTSSESTFSETSNKVTASRALSDAEPTVQSSPIDLRSPPTSKDKTTPHPSISAPSMLHSAVSLSESLCVNVELMLDSEHGLPPSGPFVTNSQSELMSVLPRNADVECQLAAANYSDGMAGEPIIDLPSLMLSEQGLGAGLVDVTLFADIPQTSPDESRKAPAKGKRGRPKGVNRQKAGEKADMTGREVLDPDVKSDIAQQRLRCRRCSERFTSKTDYQQHLKSQICSTGYTQTYTCQVCGYCALTRQRLIVHMRTHSGERPHRCPFCSYAATQQAPLKRHMQNIHLKAGAISLTNPKQPVNPPVKS